MSTSKVTIFNISDSGSPKLKQFGLDNRTFAVIDALISPGQSGTVDGDKWTTFGGNYKRLITLGALAVGTLPPSYVVSMANQQTGASKAASPKAATPAVPPPPPLPPTELAKAEELADESEGKTVSKKGK